MVCKSHSLAYSEGQSELPRSRRTVCGTGTRGVGSSSARPEPSDLLGLFNHPVRTVHGALHSSTSGLTLAAQQKRRPRGAAFLNRALSDLQPAQTEVSVLHRQKCLYYTDRSVCATGQPRR